MPTLSQKELLGRPWSSQAESSEMKAFTVLHIISTKFKSTKLLFNRVAQSLTEMGEALKQLAEVKFALEDNCKQNFLEPLTHQQNKDIRDVMVLCWKILFLILILSTFQHHRKKLEGRRLDFDCKKRGVNIPLGGGSALNIRAAEEKFEESYNLAAMGMFNLLQNEPEQISQLAAFSEALFEYHSQSANILESLTQRLMEL